MSERNCDNCRHKDQKVDGKDCGPCLDSDVVGYPKWKPIKNAAPTPSAPSASETDPLGRDQHQPGAKLDAGKVRLGLVLGDFSRALVEVGKVGTYGAQKYTDGGWITVPNGPARYRDAHLRHMLAPVPNDTDTGLSHLAHAAWNALAELELHLRAQQ